MSELQRFVPEDQELLVGIFYRTGYWISTIDDTDVGEESERREMRQLLLTLEKISNAQKAGALVNELAAEALRQKGSWRRWENANDDYLADLDRAVIAAKGQTNDGEFKSFSRAILMIGTAVAEAFREEVDNAPEPEGYFAWLSEKANTVLLAVTDKQSLKDMNISPSEDDALHQIVATLKS